MPVLEYPINGNPRRGYDVDLISQVPVTVSALWGETLTFRFLMNEGVLSAGLYAQLSLTVTDGNIADTTTFILADQLFTVDNSIPSNTATSVNFNQSDALTHAQNLQAAILSNPFFSNRVQAFVTPNGSDYDITVTWLKKGEQFSAGSTMPAPYTMVNEITGADVELVEGYALVYQVWMDDAGDIKPITDWRAVAPQISASQDFGSLEIEVNDALRPYLSLAFPYGAKNVASVESGARRKWWILWGWREIDRTTGNAQAVFHTIQQTDAEWVTYSALQETDRFGMRPYFVGGDAQSMVSYPVKYMTKRPHFKVGRNSIGWLYIYLDLLERLDESSTTYFYYVDRWNGSAWVNVSVTNLGTADGVYRMPAHPANLPTALPSTATLYRTEVRADLGSGENTYASQEWEIIGCDPAIQVWFLGDLACYEDFSFDQKSEEEIVVDMAVELVPIAPFDRDTTALYGERLSTGGRRVVNVRNYRRITGTVDALCDKEAFVQYLESFLKSPLKYARFLSKIPPDTGSVANNEVQRSVFVDPGSVVFREEGGTVSADISFYYHDYATAQV